MARRHLLSYLRHIPLVRCFLNLGFISLDLHVSSELDGTSPFMDRELKLIIGCDLFKPR